MNTCNNHTPKFIDFGECKPIKPPFMVGKIYTYTNEQGNEEKGECISYDEGKVKLKIL